MIGILSLHPDDVFLQKLNLPYSIIDNVENSLDLTEIKGLFIDWVPKMSMYEDAWMKQASLLQAYIKSGIPIVIFDRGMSLSKKEVDWVKKFNTHLFEPALNSGRNGFNYLPEWVSTLELVLEEEDEKDRIYDVVYSHHKLEYNIKEFEKWFSNYGLIFPDKKIAYSSFSGISDFKKEEYKKNNLEYRDKAHPLFNEGIFTVAIETEESYKIGYFNPIYFNAMSLGCLPLLPTEHKYFHAMFKRLVAKDIKEMDYYVSLYGRVKNVIIEELFERIKNDWPEFTVDHAANSIRSCYE
jgi:hypothetical protein